MASTVEMAIKKCTCSVDTERAEIRSARASTMDAAERAAVVPLLEHLISTEGMEMQVVFTSLAPDPIARWW